MMKTSRVWADMGVNLCVGAVKDNASVGVWAGSVGVGGVVVPVSVEVTTLLMKDQMNSCLGSVAMAGVSMALIPWATS